MKRTFTGILMLLMIFAFTSVAGAYSYSFDIQQGGISLDVAAGCESLSIATYEDLVVDLALDLPSTDIEMEYTASIHLGVFLYGAFGMPLDMDDFSLGQMGTIDPSVFLGDGVNPVSFASDPEAPEILSGEFWGYTLTDALLEYDFTFTPTGEADQYSIHIEDVSISGGNTSGLLNGIISELAGSSPISLTPPFTIPIALSGTMDIEAVPLKADAVPVPSAIWLLGTGLIGLAGLRREKRG